MLQWRIGDVTVTRVVEIETPSNPRWLYRDMTPEALERHAAWLRPHFLVDRGLVPMAIQTFVVESEGARIVVDTCVGNDKERQLPFWNHLQGPFLDRLEEAGFAPEAIDLVLCTHLHVDHVGWNTRWQGERWVPTFPQARYLFGREELAHWSAVHSERAIEQFADSVAPIVEAGLVDAVESDHRITGEVWLEPTPGHSPGHVSVRISSRGEEAVITGDVMHHPVQCAEPDWACAADSNSAQAKATRRAFLARYAEVPVLVIGTHFAAPTSGHIRRDGAVWRFDAGG